MSRHRGRKKVKTLHFSSQENYRKWEAYGHNNHTFNEKSQPKIMIRGKEHKVEHRED